MNSNGKIINSKEKLPEWFNLSNYEDTRILGVRSWFLVIASRRQIQKVINMMEIPLKVGLPVPAVEDYLRQFGMDMLKEIVRRPTQADEEALNKLLLDCCRVPTSEALFDYAKKACEAKEFELLVESGFSGSSVPVLIDLGLSDQSIINRLTTLLPELRSQYLMLNAPQRKKKHDIKKWSEFGLLPYIDLRLWERLSGCHITWEVISEAISTSDEIPEEQTRQTVDPIAKDLVFEGQGMSVLERQVVAEAI